jgi:hypothetical protein
MGEAFTSSRKESVMKGSSSFSQTSFTAIVHAADGVRFVARGPNRQSLTEQLVAYILSRCDEVLWPPTARQVRALVEAGRPTEAVDLYFADVGDRWDEERLELGGISFDSHAVAQDPLTDARSTP